MTPPPPSVPETAAVSRRGFLAASGAALAALAVGTRRARALPLDRIAIVDASGNLTPVFEELLKQQGILQRFGLQSQPLYVADGSKIMGSLLSGEMDLCPMAGFAQVFPAIEHGARLKIVNGAVVLGQQTVFSGKPGIATVADLKGRTIGVGSLGAQSHQVMVALLLKNGIDPAAVTFANIGSSADIFRAIAAKVVDAGPAQIDFIPQCAKVGVHVVGGGDMWTSLPDYPFQGGFTTERAIAAKRDILERALAAYATLFRFVGGPDSRDAFLAARRKALGGSGEEFDAASAFQWTFLQKIQPLAKELVLSPERIAAIQTLNVRLGTQRQVMSYEQVTDMSLARGALTRI